MASQIVNNRSATGIVEYDDGAGGLLSGGKLTCNHMDTVTSEFDHVVVLHDFDLQGSMTVAGTTITPTWLSYLYGLTGNIQTQLNTVIGTHLGANNIWTGINTFTNAVNFTGATIYGLSKVSVGLPNVDNTADSAKPISNAQASVNTTTSNAITANTNEINSNTTKIATNTANIATNAANIATNSTNIATNTADIFSNTSDIATNTADIATNTIDIAVLQSSYTIQSLAVGTTTTGEEGTNASVLNVGTATNQELSFTIPRGYRGYTGSKGDTGDRGRTGEDGKDGKDGSDGAPGDSSAATAAAAVAAGSAAAAATAAGASAASAGAAAASAAAAAASASLNNVEVQEIKVKLNALDLEVNQLDTDVATLKQKTQNITGTSTLTLINSELQTNQINATGLYVADSIIVAGEVKSSNGFSGGVMATNIGGLTNTNIKGPAINIGTSEVLFNTVTIGSSSSVVTINGIVNYTNPFNNFFEQW